MKRFAKRSTALVLALVLAVGAMGQTALASWALGTELVEQTAKLAEGVSWTTQSLWSASKSDLRTENYITYIPGSGVVPMVYSGTYVTSRSTVAAAASELKKQGYQVIAGVNGSLFNSDGTIVGMLMTEGVVRALDVYNYALLGFTWDGQVFIDESRITKNVSWETGSASRRYDLAGFNAYRNSDILGGLYLYNQDFYSKVNCDTSRGYVAVVLTPEPNGKEATDGDLTPESDDEKAAGDALTSEPNDGEAADDTQTPAPNSGVTMNGTLALWVEEIVDTEAGDTFNGKLTDGRYLLYANRYNGNDTLLNALRSLKLGQQVEVSVSGVSEQWADAAYGISAMHTLLRDGKIVPNKSTESNPCTAVGIKEDGTAVFYTIDGRQSGYSVGATYEQVAQRLQELGCVTAVALDGGGSTTLGATLPGQQKFELMNHPSQIGRAVNNSIFLVAEEEYAGMDPGFYLSSDVRVVFIGATLNVSAVGYDKWGKADPEMTPVWSAAGGTIEGDGLTAVYTAGDTAGDYTISAGAGSKLPVRVVKELSRLTITGENNSSVSSVSLRFLETVDLSASGQWQNLPVALDDENVTWSVSGNIGSIDGQGRFTAGAVNASGEITASAGGKTATVSVTVEDEYPFTDIEGHWSADYVTRLNRMGLTNGYGQPDGTFIYRPDGQLSRGELLVFITRLLHVDTDEYQDVTLPFADLDTIPEWMLPSVKAMYALCVLNGSSRDGNLYANVNNSVSREEAMTMLGRILAELVSQDLSDFADNELVNGWAQPYVETLVALGVVEGSGGKLNPQSNITRGEVAKLLVKIDSLEKAELTLRPSDPEVDEPDTPDGPDQPGEGTDDPVSPDVPDSTPGDLDRNPDQSGEDTDDSISPDVSGSTPDNPDRNPDQSGKDTDDPVSPDVSDSTPDNPDRNPGQSGENTGGSALTGNPSPDPGALAG